jgi:hypothetical protein
MPWIAALAAGFAALAGTWANRPVEARTMLNRNVPARFMVEIFTSWRMPHELDRKERSRERLD